MYTLLQYYMYIIEWTVPTRLKKKNRINGKKKNKTKPHIGRWFVKLKKFSKIICVGLFSILFWLVLVYFI